MSIEKFVFKFTDHETKKNMMVKVMIHITEIPDDWHYTPTDEGKKKMLEWYKKYHSWYWELKHRVKQTVRTLHFKGKEGFDGHKFYKKIISNKDYKVNMNELDNPQIRMRCVWGMHKMKMKYMKGKKTMSMTNKYEYPTTKHYHQYRLTTKYLAEQITIEPVASPFTLTMEAKESLNKSMSGGLNDDYIRYMKYKKKYLNLKG